MLSLGSPEQAVPTKHPLRRIKKLADAVLSELSPTFDAMYAGSGRPSVPPERLLKGMLLMALYSVRSERMLSEQLGYNLLFKWFLDMRMDEAPFDPTTFGKNRDRILEHDVAHEFFRGVVGQARRAGLMSSEHFSVDGTLIDAWASMKSVRPKDEDDDDNDSNGWADFRGEKRSNDTHESKTDPEAKLMRKGKGREAKLSYVLNALMENRNGLLVGVQVDEATGTAERDGALDLIERELPGNRRITVGADKGYDTKDFVARLRELNATPHVAQNITEYRGSAIDARTTSRPGYRASEIVRRRIESIFGWGKSTGSLRKSRFKGKKKTNLWVTIVGAAYNLLRVAKLAPA